jgi:hypothetical protein
MGSHSRGPSLKGARTKLIDPLCLEDLLSESAFARGASFVGAPVFVGALCHGAFGTCLNPALVLLTVQGGDRSLNNPIRCRAWHGPIILEKPHWQIIQLFSFFRFRPFHVCSRLLAFCWWMP